MFQVTVTNDKINTSYDILSHNCASKLLHTKSFHWLITEATCVEEYYCNFDIKGSWVYFCSYCVVHVILTKLTSTSLLSQTADVKQNCLSSKTSFRGCLRKLVLVKGPQVQSYDFSRAFDLQGVSPHSCPGPEPWTSGKLLNSDQSLLIFWRVIFVN